MEFERKFRLIEKFLNKKYTDDSQVKNISEFFSDKDNNSEINTLLKKNFRILT